MSIKVTEVRPGMVYLGKLIIATEFFGNIARLYFEDGTKKEFSKDSYILIGEIIDV